MSFIDLFKSRESREKQSHLKNLVAVAFADGKSYGYSDNSGQRKSHKE